MKKRLLIILIIFLYGQSLLAQTPHFRNYTVDDGLPSSHVYRAFQDSRGFIWFCTDKGLARFDGYKFEKFSTKNGLPNNDIWQCAEDSEHRIWFLSYANAFFYFDLKDNKFYKIENPYKQYYDSHVACYVQEGKNKLKVILNNVGKYLTINLDRKNPVNLYNIPQKEGNIYPIQTGEVYIPINNLNISKSLKGNREWFVRALSESLEHNLLHKPHILPNIKIFTNEFWYNVISIEFDDNKTIYGTNDSISFFRNNQFYTKRLNDLTNTKNDILNLILSTGTPKKKLIVTERDIFVIDENLNRERKLDFIKNFNVNTIFFDKEENIWLCTQNQGVFLLSKKSMSSNIFTTLGSQSVSTIAKDKFNRIWLGTNTGNIYYLNEKNELKQQVVLPKSNIPIKRIITNDKNLVIAWNSTMFTSIPLNMVGRDDPITLENLSLETGKGTIQEINRENSLKMFTGFAVKNFTNAPNGHIILATSGALVDFSINGKAYRIEKKALYTKHLAVIAKNEGIYSGTNNGILKIQPTNELSNLALIKQKYPVLTKPISCFAEDAQNALWTGTDGYGVYRLLNDKVQQISELSGIIVNYLYSEKENDRIWVATNEGIFLLKLNLKTSQLTYAIQKISLAQGLPTLEVNCLTVRNDELFVGTSKGLAMLPIQNIIDEEKVKTQIPLIIKNIKINRLDTTVTQYYDLNYRQNNLDIEFVALSYKSDKNIKYDYKMISNNSDTLWHSVQDLHKEFSLLASGKYEFSLRAFDINGNPSQSIKPIIFIINPPFWDTAWFKTLVALFIITAIILFFYLRTKNIQKKEEQKTQINKKFAELELQALQAQMNPHFVFNALSAIQNFILNNDAEEATDYLSRFSRLMRLFLESSRNKYISLSDEKVLLEYYIQLEQLRFKDKFSYRITLGAGVSLDTEIPSMLLQPFVENSINHGLVYKENNEGYLNIDFKRETDALICTIDDNGIGREKAAEIKSKSLKSYKSRGTEITEERLRSLELIENTKIEINIIDKKDENQVAIGTKIIIVMYL